MPFTPDLHLIYTSFTPHLHLIYTSFTPDLHLIYTSFTPAESCGPHKPKAVSATEKSTLVYPVTLYS